MSKSFLFEHLYHARDIFLRIRLAFPEVEFHIQILIVLLQIFHRHMHDVFPNRPVSTVSVLKQIGCLQCFFPIFFMLFRICACRRINLFQLADRKRGFFRILSRKVFVKIRKFRLTFLQFGDDQSHLVSPVSQMDISDHFIPFQTRDPFDTLADDRGT